MSPVTIFLKLLLEALHGVLMLVTIVILLDIQKLKQQHLVNWLLSIFVIYSVLFAAIWLVKKWIPKSCAAWWEFPRDRITEDSKRPWWRTLISILGGLVNFVYYIGIMLLAMFIAMTEGGHLPYIVAAFVLFGIHLVAEGLLHIGRLRCRMCQTIMPVERAKRLLDGEWNWYVCFRCKIRALAPEEDISVGADDGGDSD